MKGWVGLGCGGFGSGDKGLQKLWSDNQCTGQYGGEADDVTEGIETRMNICRKRRWCDNLLYPFLLKAPYCLLQTDFRLTVDGILVDGARQQETINMDPMVD